MTFREREDDTKLFVANDIVYSLSFFLLNLYIGKSSQGYRIKEEAKPLFEVSDHAQNKVRVSSLQSAYTFQAFFRVYISQVPKTL